MKSLIQQAIGAKSERFFGQRILNQWRQAKKLIIFFKLLITAILGFNLRRIIIIS